MIRRTVLALPLFLALSACREDFSWNQKLTLVVETPTGEISASSVSAVQVWIGAKIFPDSPNIGNDFVGEATFVEVTPGRYLFALISSGPGWAGATFAPISDERDFATRMRTVEQQLGAPAKEIPRNVWPMLVTFDDVADSTTVRRVDPNDLAASFGPGVRLKTITLEITREPTTVGPLDKLLPWLGPYPEPFLGKATGGDVALAPFHNRVTMGDFIRRPR